MLDIGGLIQIERAGELIEINERSFLRPAHAPGGRYPYPSLSSPPSTTR